MEMTFNDLFEFLEIKGENQKLFNEFCSLLIRYPENIIKESWKDIFPFFRSKCKIFSTI